MIDDSIVTGINHIWNNRFEEAEAIYVSKKDTSARYALHYAEAAFLRSFITADTNDTETALARLKAAKKLAESTIKVLEKPVAGSDKKANANLMLDAKVVHGDTLYMLAVLQLTRDSKLKGVLNMRKSWKVFEESLNTVKHNKEENFYDAEIVRCLNFGAGFFLFAMSIIPQKFLKWVELGGFRADRDAGLKYMQEAHESGGVRAPFGTIVLLFNNLILPRGLANPEKYLVEADSLVQQSLQKYPQGSLFHVMGSHCARKRCNVDLGIKYMLEAIENCKCIKAEPLIYKYELANCYCMQLDWATAATHFEPLAEEAKFQVRALCALQLGSVYVMTGQKDKAAAVFAKIPTIINKSSSVDPIVVKQGARYIANGGWFSAFELLYMRRDLAKMEKIMEQTLEVFEKQAANTNALKPIVVDPKSKGALADMSKKFAGFGFGKKKEEVIDHSPDDRASYLLIKGAMLKSMNKADEAIAHFRELQTLESVVREKWYLAYGLFELGESLYMQGDLKGAQENMKKCNNMSGYDWEDPLKVRLRVVLDQLKKGGVIEDSYEEAASVPSTPTTGTPSASTPVAQTPETSRE